MLNIDRLETTVAAQMHSARIPGLALAIITDHELQYARGFGVTTTVDGAVPVTADTLFRIGSISKTLTATLIMRLVEAGALDLDAAIIDYIPWLSIRSGDIRTITLRTLMSMTSGLMEGSVATAEYPLPPLRQRRDLRGLEEHIRDDFPYQFAVAPPRAIWWYNTGGTNLTGHIAEVAGKRPFADLMHERVLAPLGMTHTMYDPSVAMTYPVALPHAILPDGSVTVERNLLDYVWMYPGAFAFSTVRDLAQIALLHLRSATLNGSRFLTAESIAQMQKSHGVVGTATQLNYGLNLFLDTYKGVRRVGHDGVYFASRSKFVVAPDAGVGLVILHNRGEEWRVAREALLDALFDELLNLAPKSPPPPTTRPGFFRGEAGIYQNLEDGERIRLHILTGSLHVAVQDHIIPLRPITETLAIGARPPDCNLPSAPYIPTPTLGIEARPETADGTGFLMLNGKPYRRRDADAR